jgi:hypothetical protein
MRDESGPHVKPGLRFAPSGLRLLLRAEGAVTNCRTVGWAERSEAHPSEAISFVMVGSARSAPWPTLRLLSGGEPRRSNITM